MKKLLGIQSDLTSHGEKLISAVGGFLGIFIILYITRAFVGETASVLIVASMGASAVLLFAVPHGPLSQPWPLLGGHFISALIGISIRMLVPDMLLAAALAVGLSIGVMYYLRCIHPPGGASALAAVVSGPEVHALGYLFALVPVLLNATVILLVALLVNYPFKWRRYPVGLARQSEQAGEARSKHGSIGRIPRRDLEYALKSMRSFSDISEDDLEQIYQRASQHALTTKMSADDIQLGHYYLHGQLGSHGVVRRIIDESPADDPAKDMVIYKIITGPEQQKTAVCTREAFAQWAKHEVVFQDDHWLICSPDHEA